MESTEPSSFFKIFLPQLSTQHLSLQWNKLPTEKQGGTELPLAAPGDISVQSPEKKEDHAVSGAEENEWDRLLRLRYKIFWGTVYNISRRVRPIRDLLCLALVMIAMAEELGLLHLLQYGEQNIRREVPLALGLLCLSNPKYQNCLRKFYYNTDSQVLLYLARTHYEAEQWQDCKKTLLRAIHLGPSNYTLQFDTGVSMQKFSASTLQKTKRTADEVRSTVAELKNVVRVFSQLSAASSHHFHGLDEKKIETHVGYCKHLLDAAKVHCEAAEREEQQNKQRLEVARQVSLAEEARRKAEEQRKFQLERRKQEDELKKVKQQEAQFERVKEGWKISMPQKRKDRTHADDEEDGRHGEKKKRKGGKRRKQDKRSRYEMDDEADMDNHEEVEYEDANMNNQDDLNDQDDDGADNAQDVLVAAGLEDSDAEDDALELLIRW